MATTINGLRANFNLRTFDSLGLILGQVCVYLVKTMSLLVLDQYHLTMAIAVAIVPGSPNFFMSVGHHSRMTAIGCVGRIAASSITLFDTYNSFQSDNFFPQTKNIFIYE